MGTETPEEELELDLTPNAWIRGMTPLFVLEGGDNTDKIIEAISVSYKVFYVLAQHEISYQTKEGATTTTKKTNNPRVFKVVNNLAGSAISEAKEIDLGGPKLTPQATFKLPGIPFSLIQDVDDFFRSVDDKFGTEAIVLFTYDDSYLETDNPEDGWGVLVPKQTNTAGSCDYDPTSVVDDIPDGKEAQIHIVGTAHSHPGMGAFCSGTDKADQANFDGVHITFGWKKSSSQTEYHIELQMGGTAYTLSEKHAFSGAPEPLENERIKPWTDRVTKKHATSPAWTGGTQTQYSTPSSYSSASYDHLPKELPQPSGVVAVVVKTNLKQSALYNCPVCKKHMSEVSRENGKCVTCQSYIICSDIESKDTEPTISDLLELRKKAKLPSHDLDVNDKNQWKSLYLWDKLTANETVTLLRMGLHSRGDPDPKAEGGSIRGEEEDDSTGADAYQTAIPVCFNCSTPIEDDDDDECSFCHVELDASKDLLGYINRVSGQGSQDLDLDDDDEVTTSTWMLCCDGDESDCKCPESAKFSFFEVDQLLADWTDLEPYKPRSECKECIFYYTDLCDPYKEYLLQFIDLSTISEYRSIPQIDVCSEFVPISD